MSYTLHMSQSIRGALRNWEFPSDYRGVLIGDDGKHLPPTEAREYLFDCLTKGIELLPMGDCENFDYKEGCQCAPRER